MSDDAQTPLSHDLLAFVAEAPVAREPHLAFLGAASTALPPGSRVLDVGAGDAPYRELFAVHTYLTCDWEGTQYHPDRPPDIVAPAHAIPVDAGSLDAVVCTQVLEHVPEPWVVLEEFARILRPGGTMLLTAPLTWYLHELPHDYYRFTSSGLIFLLSRAGFVDIDVRPMNNSPSTLAQLLSHLGYLLGQHADGHEDRRVMAGDVAARLADLVKSMGDLDTQWWMPISFSAVARKP